MIMNVWFFSPACRWISRHASAWWCMERCEPWPFMRRKACAVYLWCDAHLGQRLQADVLQRREPHGPLQAGEDWVISVSLLLTLCQARSLKPSRLQRSRKPCQALRDFIFWLRIARLVGLERIGNMVETSNPSSIVGLGSFVQSEVL